MKKAVAINTQILKYIDKSILNDIDFIKELINIAKFIWIS
ncbi:DUF4116 domain-containing protein [Mycoplasmopsis cynos]